MTSWQEDARNRYEQAKEAREERDRQQLREAARRQADGLTRVQARGGDTKSMTDDMEEKMNNILTENGAFHGPDDEYDGQITDRGFFVRFHTISDPLDLFENAIGLFRFIGQAISFGGLPYLVCLSEKHRVAMQQALGLGVDPDSGMPGMGAKQQMVKIGYRYELDTHCVIVQAEKYPRQRQER